ncbi:MAG: TlpA family protein disulfide reductase [Thermoguttaceae bacterium]
MTTAFAWQTALLAALLAVPGCTQVDDAPPPKPDPPVSQQPSGEQPPEADPSADEQQVTVRVIDEQDLAEAIAGYRGEVVLVDFWATWCIACVQLFPHTVELHEQFADDGLRVISVSFDQPESEEAVLDFLKKHNATFDNFISRYGAGPDSPEKFDLPGTLPQLLLYDRKGELTHTFPEPQSGVDPDAVDRAVEELLAAEP